MANSSRRVELKKTTLQTAPDKRDVEFAVGKQLPTSRVEENHMANSSQRVELKKTTWQTTPDNWNALNSHKSLLCIDLGEAPLFGTAIFSSFCVDVFQI